jgi:hypothetical protein
MTTPTVTQSQNEPSLPNQPFFAWLRTHTTLFIGQMIGLLSVISVPIALIYYSHAIPTDIEWQTVGHLVIYAHLLFLVLFIAALVRTLDTNDIGSYRAKLVHRKLHGKVEDVKYLEKYSKNQVGRFKKRFLWFWCAMLVLYLTFAFEPMFSIAARDGLEELPLGRMFRTELFPILSFVLNNISLICIFRCFTVLYSPRDGTPGNYKTQAEPLKTPDNRPTERTWSRFLGHVRSIVKYLSEWKKKEEINELELRQRTLNLLFFLLILVLTAIYPLIMLTKINVKTNWSEYPAIFDALSGTISAVVLALLVARLDSKLLGLPSWLICILYFYAGVQPMFVVFELHPEVYAGIKTAVLLVVFIFKIYFFLIIFYSLQTGRLFNYFFCSQILDEHVRKLKESQPHESEAKVPAAGIQEIHHAQPSNGTASEQSEEEVEPETQAQAVAEDRSARWFKILYSAATGVFARKQGPPPAQTVEDESAKDSAAASSEQPAQEVKQDPTVTRVTESRPRWFKKLGIATMKFIAPDGQDWRAIWFKRLGVAAIVVFAGSLLVYVALTEKGKNWIDESGLSDLVVFLHVVLLGVILVWIFIAWWRSQRKRTKNVSLPGIEDRSKVRSDLLLNLTEPGARKAREAQSVELSDRTNDQLKTFTKYFRLFWISLLVLYLAMLFSNLPGKKPDDKRSSPGEPLVQAPLTPSVVPLTLFRWVSSAGYTGFEETNSDTLLAILEGNKKNQTKHLKELDPSAWSEASEQLFSIHAMPKKTNFSFVFFVINNFSVMCVFWCFTVLYIPADDKKFVEKRHMLRNYAGLICVLLTVLAPLLAIILTGNRFTQSEVAKIPTVLGALGGTLNAVAFALLIGRLDSRIIGLRALLVTVLYTYAALQPLFVTFNQPSNLLKFIATSAMIAAFIFKICLVLMIGHLRRSHGLNDYLWIFPAVNSSVNSVFNNQFEIKVYSPKPLLFTFSIFNKRVETYRAAEMYSTRSQSDDAIKALVRTMKKRENYSTYSLQGTHWVAVGSRGHLSCESKSLRSQKEADELIHDSIEKIPYCKYDRG